MLKSILLFLVSLTAAIIVVVVGYLWSAPRYGQVIEPFFPKTLFSIENAPSQSLTGEVTSITGNVVWQSRIANIAKPINTRTKLQQGEELATLGNGKAIVNFDKIANITLSPSTQIVFIQTLPVNFVVQQKEGSATYEKTGEIPTSIRALDLLVNIENGSSIVLVDKDTQDITVTPVSGRATVAFNDTNNETNILTINEGEVYSFNNNTKTGEIE